MIRERAARWTAPLLAVAVVALGGIWLLSPRPSTEYQSVDGQARWSSDAAPPRRHVVWQPAAAIADVGITIAPGDSVIRPQLAEGGAALYFTFRKAGGAADIYRARRVDGKWRDAAPLDALNSDAEDIGPVLSRDGRSLYLYSNRPGGIGKFDLFVAQRAADGGWSEPQNLGEAVNSPWDEFDPALSPDGRMLFYSSNRNGQAQKRIRSGGSRAEWPMTLRAHATLASFDLFRAERGELDRPWSEGRPLRELNRTDASTGTPYVSPDGAFLYFASNRPQRADEPLNFDLYRARIAGSQWGLVQNLGEGVNSPSDELEPALSDEGFQLYFSRSAAASGNAAETYGLYASAAIEVEETTSWDDSRRRAVAVWFREASWWIVLAALTCGLVAGLIWYARQMSLRRASVPGFFLTALGIHLLLIGSLFVVALDDDLRSRLKKEVQELVFATQLDDDPQPVPSEAEYGNRAEWRQVETVQPAELQRQAMNAPRIAAPSDVSRHAPSVPSGLPFVVPAEQPASSAPDLALSVAPPQLPRRAADVAATAETVEPLDAPPVEAAPQAAPERLDVALTRMQPAPEIEAAQPASTPPARIAPLRPENVTRQQTEEAPVAKLATLSEPVMQRQKARDAPVADSMVELGAVAAEQPSSLPAAPEAAAVDVARRAPADPTQSAGLPPRQPISAAPSLMREVAPVEQPGDQALEIRSAASRSALARAERAPAAAAAESVPTEMVAPLPVASSSSAPPSAAIGVARRTVAAPQPLAGLPPRQTVASSPAVTREAIPVERAGDQVLEIRSDSSPLALARAERAPVSLGATDSVPTEAVTGPPAGASMSEPPIATIDVAQRDDPGPLAPRMAAERPLAGIASPAAPQLVQRLDGQVEFDEFKPTDRPAALSMQRRPPAVERASVSESIATLAPLGESPASTTGEAQSNSLAVNVQRMDEALPVPGGSGVASSPDSLGRRPLTVDPDVLDSAAQLVAERPGSTDVAAPVARIGAAGRREPAEEIAAESVAAAANPANAANSQSPPPMASAAVGVARSGAQVVESLASLGAGAASSAGELPRLATASPDIQGSAENPEIPATSFSLARNTDRSPNRPFAEDDIGLQAMLRLRQSEAKSDLLVAFGGNVETESAVERGLNWMEVHQQDEGHWSLNLFTQMCEKHHKAHHCTGAGVASDTAATGFALLPFLGAGHTHREGPHQESIARGLKWLVEHQKPNGDTYMGGGGNSHMYSHGIASIALCEAYAMTRDPALREPAQKAIDFIVSAQHAPSGGWRYTPGQDGDTSVFGWQVMALKSGQMANLNVPAPTLEKARGWLNRVGATGPNLGRFGYVNNSPNLTMTAEGLLCLQYLGAERNDPRLVAGAKYLAENLPTKETSYYWYYGTQVMFHMQGEPWQEWNVALRKQLVETQVTEGSMAGTWNPTDNWEKSGGRIYSTALRLLMLEVYYRHLPLYQVLEE